MRSYKEVIIENRALITDKDIRNMKVSYGYSRVPQPYIMIYYYKGDAMACKKQHAFTNCTVHNYLYLCTYSVYMHESKTKQLAPSLTSFAEC